MCRFAKWKSVVAVLTIAVIQPRSIADEVWQSLGSGMDSYVRALAIYNGELIAGGDFFTAGGQGASRVARWDGGAWQSLGSGMNNSVQALAVYNNELIADFSPRRAV